MISDAFSKDYGTSREITIFFIHRYKLPQSNKVTYSHIVCDILTQKKEIHRVKLTVGGDKLISDGPVSTPTSDLTNSKIHRNTIISTPGAKYPVVDVNKFYLNNPMSKNYYYKIALSLIPQDVIYKYNLMDKKMNGFIYVMA